MINPITKGIVALATAMGYGKESDYKGTSVAEVLSEVFEKMGYGAKSDYKVSTVTDVLYDAAKIAKDKGGPGGGVNAYFVDVDYSDQEHPTITASFSEAKKCFMSDGLVFIKIMADNAYFWLLSTDYLDNYNNTGKEAIEFAAGQVTVYFLSDGTLTY